MQTASSSLLLRQAAAGEHGADGAVEPSLLQLFNLTACMPATTLSCSCRFSTTHVLQTCGWLAAQSRHCHCMQAEQEAFVASNVQHQAEKAKLEEAALPLMLDVMWAANLMDIQSTLRHVARAVRLCTLSSHWGAGKCYAPPGSKITRKVLPLSLAAKVMGCKFDGHPEHPAPRCTRGA